MRRLSASSLRRLEQLERPRTERTGGVLVVPKIIYDLAAWEAQAMPQQAKLIADIRN